MAGRGTSIRRSNSLNDDLKKQYAHQEERIKLSKGFKARNYKANTSDYIKEPFTTLEEMFRVLPVSIGFNIEMSECSSLPIIRRSLASETTSLAALTLYPHKNTHYQ